MRTIESINDTVKNASWDALLFKFVPEENRERIKKTRQKHREFQDKLWKELCTQKMVGLEREYKEIFGIFLEEVDVFPTYLNSGYPKGCERVANCLNTIQEAIDYKREQLKKVQKDAELKAEQEAQKKQEEIRQKAEQEENRLKEEKSKAEILALRCEISTINFSVLRADTFTIQSSVNDFLDCRELKNDAGLIAFKREVQTLETQIEEEVKQAKTAKDKTEKEQLEELLTTTKQNYSILLERYAETKRIYAGHSERVKPAILKLSQTFKDLKNSTLIFLKRYENSYTDQKRSVQAVREKRLEIKISDEKTLQELANMEQTIDKNKAEIEKDIACIEKISIDEIKDTPRVKSNRISQIRMVSVKEEGYKENFEKNEKQLSDIIKESEVHERSLQEIKKASDHLKQLKSKKEALKETSVSSLDNIVEQTKKQSTISFWNSGKKCDKAISLQARIANLRIWITESLKEGSQGSLKVTIDALQKFIEKIEDNELKAYEDAATTTFFCRKSMNTKDRLYLQSVKKTLGDVKTDLSEVAKGL